MVNSTQGPHFYDINNFTVESVFGFHTCEGYNSMEEVRESAVALKFDPYGIIDIEHTYQFVEHVPANKGHGSYILKLSDRFYKTLVGSVNKGSLNVTCHKRSGKSPCKFRASLNMVKVFDPKSEGFYSSDNFIIKPSKGLETHTCEGYRTIFEARDPNKYKMIQPPPEYLPEFPQGLYKYPEGL